MGSIRFSLHMLKKEYKRSIIYTLTLCLSIAITFVFFNIIDNMYLLSKEEISVYQQSGVNIPFSSMLSFLIIMFCAFMIIFANNFYLSQKTKEMAIMTMSGASITKITLYLFMQNLVMTLIAFPIGIGVGYLFAIGINQVIYQIVGSNGSLFYIPTSAIIDTITCIIAIIGVQLMYASGFVYRKDIHYLLTQNAKQVATDTRIIKLPSFFYVFIYVIGFVILFTSNYSATMPTIPCFIGALGIGGMVKYVFPKVIKRIKDRVWLKDSIALLSVSHLYYSFSRTMTLMSAYGVMTSLLVALMISQYASPREYITSFIGYIVVILLLLASIYYKYRMETSDRRIAFYNLYKLGYSMKQLKKIIKKEVLGYYATLMILPGLYVLSTLFVAYSHHDIDMIFVLSVCIVQVVLISVFTLLTYISYKKMILGVIEEGMRYE